MKNLRLLRKSISFRILLLSAVSISFSNHTTQDDLLFHQIATNEVADQSTCYDMTKQEDKPRLFAFIVGFTPPNIKWTVEDAEDMEKALNRQKNRGLYEDVIVETLVGEDASADGTIEALRKFFYGHEIKETDVFIFYASSHGYRNGRKFSLEASNFNELSPENTSVHLNDLKEIFNEVKAKKLLFIDACDSGFRVPNPLLPRLKFGAKSGAAHEAFKEILKAKSGYTIITSSIGKSYNHDAWQNSAFTEAFLEGLQGAADLNRDSYITTSEIYKYLNVKIPLLCKEQLISDLQRPDYLRFKTDIPFIALDRKSEDYRKPLADPVPLSHEESGLITYIDYEMDYKPETTSGEAEKWEQEPITLFQDYQNGEPYLEGRIIFMGTEKKVGLRIEIAIEGDATGYFGRDLPILVINFGDTKKRYVTSNFSYMFKSDYDPVRHKTFYIMAYDFTKQDKKLLESREATSVDVGWTSGKKRYKVTNPDAFMRQLDNIQKAENDGIIEKLKLNKR